MSDEEKDVQHEEIESSLIEGPFHEEREALHEENDVHHEENDVHHEEIDVQHEENDVQHEEIEPSHAEGHLQEELDNQVEEIAYIYTEGPLEEEKAVEHEVIELAYIEGSRRYEDGEHWLEQSALPEDDDEEDFKVEPNENRDNQYDKILSYDYKYAPPLSEAGDKLENQTPIPHTDYNFDEKDYRRHRKISQHYHEPIRPLVKDKSQKRKKSRKEENKGEKDKFSKSPQKFHAIKVMPQIAENKELTQEQISDHEMEGAVWPKDQKEGPPRKHRHRHRSDKERSDKPRHHHHRHHHHHHRGFSESDSLESRVRTGLQTLQEEKKAIFGIRNELEEDQILGKLDKKDRDTIQSHRYEHLKGVRRRVARQRPKSGMTTHISEESLTEKPTHMKITLPKYKEDHTPKEGFVELEELTCGTDNEMQWKERARWIKFEEDVEQNEQWGKPHIASLSFHSLLELRKGIESGTVLLDLEAYNLQAIFESVVENMVITDQLSRSNKDKVIDVLMSKHRHQHQQSKLKRNFSFSSLSSFTMDSPGTPRDKDSGIESAVDIDINKGETLENEAAVTLNDVQVDDEKAHENSVIIKDSVVFEVGDIDEEDRAHNRSTTEFQLVDSSSDDGERRPTVSFGPPTVVESGDFKTVSDVKGRVPEGAEATSVLVGTMPELYQPTMAFVRLAKGCFLGNLTEVSIPVRFLFVLLGPESRKKELYEVGRSIATLMSDKIFHDLAYAAKSRDDLLSAINSFLDDSVVLAPGDWDRHLLLPLLEAEVALKKRHRKMLLREKAAAHEVPADKNPFIRTGRIFGGLQREFRRKKRHYISDFKDGLNLRCAITCIFIFFATLAPTITFGGLLRQKTEGWLGVQETLIATSLCGILFALFAGQPLIIVGTTGPILVFEQATYELCKLMNVEFLPMRFWIGMWVLVILLTVVAFEGCYLVEYFSRFTEEIVSILISLLFIYEAIYFLVKVFKYHPLRISYGASEATAFINSSTYSNIFTANNQSSNTTLPPTTNEAVEMPNTALMSLTLAIGTFLIALFLRKLRSSHFFSSKWRRVMSDFGVPIAMVIMVCVDGLTRNVYTEKIQIPRTLRPTKAERTGFFVHPLGVHKSLELGYIILGIIPAILVSILIFMETELTGVLLNKKRNKLRKGGGFNLDLFMMGILTGISSVLGLPWMCAATIRSVQHINALVIMSRCHAPGERPYLVEVKEQRLTNVLIHLLMGCVVFLSSVLAQIPIAVLFGVFFYLGIISLFSGIQFMEQLCLFFMPRKYHPSKRYIYMIPLFKILLYTAVQLLCLIILFIIKLTPVAPLFPFFFICMALIRKYLGRFFTEEELEELDNEEDSKEYDSDLDEYDTVYFPI